MSALTLSSAAALCGAMIVLAALPSLSVLTVTARAAAGGFGHGALATLGIVVGDAIFILIAVVGLSVLAEALGDGFVIIRLLGGAYLIWFGVQLWRAETRTEVAQATAQKSGWSSFLAGLLLTLADQKAILFYLGFFPAFVDLSALSALDVAAILVIATLAVGGVKLVYAWLASRAAPRIASRASRGLRRFAALMMLLVGLVLIVRS
jgi:threonine/homoserine/homoserine lactone efflux protein